MTGLVDRAHTPAPGEFSPGRELAGLLAELARTSGLSERPDVAGRIAGLASLDLGWQGRMLAYFDVFGLLSEASADETCNASERKLAPGTSAFLVASLARSSTLGELLRGLAEGYNLFHRGAFNRVERSGGQTVYIIDDEGFPYASAAFEPHRHSFIESTLVYVHCIAETFSGGRPVRASRIETRRPGPVRSDFLGFWTAPVRFGASRYALHFDSRDLMVAPAAGPGMAPAARITLNSVVAPHLVARGTRPAEDALVADVRAILGKGFGDQARIARQLGMSIATLRRRLAERGQTFRTLRAEAASLKARELLGDGHPVEEVAARLGFSDARSFSRAFKAWTGLTPAAFAAAH